MTDPHAIPTNPQVWRIHGNSAALAIAQLTGQVQVKHPEKGIHRVAIGGAPLDGFVLSVVDEQCRCGSSALDVDVFVRGEDLIANFPESTERRFSWQVYWRATTTSAAAIMLDAIVSIQTRLLESFPRLQLRSELPGGEVLSIDQEGNMMRLECSSEFAPADEPVCETADCLLLRPADTDWSYAEMSAGEDGGSCMAVIEDGIWRTRRQIGGQFLEKGVIRRERIRGVFLPRQDDSSLAGECWRTLLAERPPLTA